MTLDDLIAKYPEVRLLVGVDGLTALDGKMVGDAIECARKAVVRAEKAEARVAELEALHAEAVRNFDLLLDELERLDAKEARVAELEAAAKELVSALGFVPYATALEDECSLIERLCAAENRMLDLVDGPSVSDGAPGDRCEKHKDIPWGRQTWTGIDWGPCVHCERQGPSDPESEDDGFNCCDGNDQGAHHTSDCPEHPWVDEPPPECMSAPGACPHAPRVQQPSEPKREPVVWADEAVAVIDAAERFAEEVWSNNRTDEEQEEICRAVKALRDVETGSEGS